MIRSKADYQYYINADRIACSLPNKKSTKQIIKDFVLPNYLWRFQKSLRHLEYIRNTKKGIIGNIQHLFALRKHRKLSLKLGFTIPPNVFGPGLSIAHYGTIVVNGNAKVGNNCRIHANVNIGTKAGFADVAPTIGNNCYIGPGAKIFGEIEIADNTIIGANAVVNKSFENKNKVIAGVPAKVIGEIDILDVLKAATKIIELGLSNDDSLCQMPSLELKQNLLGKSFNYSI